jgi:hypothetical protein
MVIGYGLLVIEAMRGDFVGSHRKHGKGFVDEALGVVAALKIIKKSDQKSFKIINDGRHFNFV